MSTVINLVRAVSGKVFFIGNQSAQRVQNPGSTTTPRSPKLHQAAPVTSPDEMNGKRFRKKKLF